LHAIVNHSFNAVTHTRKDSFHQHVNSAEIMNQKLIYIYI